MTVRHTYISHHIPSGQRFEYEADFESDTDFLRHLNEWNRIGGGEYMYRSFNRSFPPQVPMVNQSHGKRIGDQPTRVNPLVEASIDELLGDEPQQGC